MKNVFKWTGITLLLVGLGVGGTLATTGQLSSAFSPAVANAQGNTEGGAASTLQTVKIQPAANVIGRVSASGKIALANTRYVVLDVNGKVMDVQVKAGDTIEVGETLLSLDTSDLERTAKRAELSVDTVRNSLDQLKKPASEIEIAAAQADLVSAQKKLEDAQKPASQAEIASARANISSNWSKYNELKAPKTADEITKLEANLRKAEIAVQEAQRDYDKVKWMNDVGMTPEASKLQQATIDYESAQADYAVTTKEAKQSDLQGAISSAQNAEKQLEDLLKKPNQADIAASEAQVATAQKKLNDLKNGKDVLELEAAQIKLDSALVDLQEAYDNLNKARVTAPIAGTVLSVSAEVGQKLNSGSTVFTIADLNALELTVNVAEIDIDQIVIGQPADVSIDALNGEKYTGKVTRVNPVSNGGSGVVSYKVTLLLDQTSVQGVFPDMTAVAKLANTQAESGWLVPTTAITNGAVTVTRNGQAQQVPVVAGAQQGEWTVVQSSALQAGDEVSGTVASYENGTDELEGFGGPPGDGG